MSDPTQRPPGEQPPPSAPPPGGTGYPQQQYGGGYPAQPGAGAGGPSGPRASFGQRLGAYLLDVLIVSVPLIILFMIVGGIASTADEGGQRAAAGGIVLLAVLGSIASALYFIILQGGPTGQTLGKRALGIRVVSFQTGGPIGYGKAFVRWLIESFISGNICLLGYLWMLWDNEKQTWHDKISDSVVVPVSAYPIQR